MSQAFVFIYSTLFRASAQGQILSLNMAMGWSTAGPELRLEIARLTSHAIDVIYDVAWPLF